jgi:hypothetical protein
MSAEQHSSIVYFRQQALISPKKTKRKRANKRKECGYDSREPNMCSNCEHYSRALKIGREYFPPRCEKHLFQVAPHAVCNTHAEAEISITESLLEEQTP